MCQPKPGPRCAHHLTMRLRALQRTREAAHDAWLAGGPPLDPAVEREIARVEWLLDQTPTGLRRLAAQIDQLEATLRDEAPRAPTGDPAERMRLAALRERHAAAAERRNRRLAAARSTREGQPRRAEFQLRYGAQAGWLAETEIPIDARTLYVGDRYAVAHVETVDRFEERDSSHGRGAVVSLDLVAFVAPASAHRDGTFRVGPPGSRGWVFDPQQQTFGRPGRERSLQDAVSLLPVIDPTGRLGDLTSARTSPSQVVRATPARAVVTGGEQRRWLYLSTTVDRTTAQGTSPAAA